MTHEPVEQTVTKVSTKQSSKNLDINRTLFKGQDVETAASWLHSTRQIIAVGIGGGSTIASQEP
nr:transcriptional regulator [Vibrio cyclitrophicus]